MKSERTLKLQSDAFTNCLRGSVPNYGAREWLSARLAKRAVPFIPIQAFGLKMNEPQLSEEPGLLPSGDG